MKKENLITAIYHQDDKPIEEIFSDDEIVNAGRVGRERRPITAVIHHGNATIIVDWDNEHKRTIATAYMSRDQSFNECININDYLINKKGYKVKKAFRRSE